MSIACFQNFFIAKILSLLLHTREYTRCDGLLQLLNKLSVSGLERIAGASGDGQTRDRTAQSALQVVNGK